MNPEDVVVCPTCEDEVYWKNMVHHDGTDYCAHCLANLKQKEMLQLALNDDYEEDVE